MSSKSREEILREIGKVSWYHQVDLGHGVVTPGIHASDLGLRKLDQVGLPRDCSGLRALDIGARDGFFSFALERRGAEVLAMDYAWPGVNGFAIAREILGSRVERIVENVYNLDPEKHGHFDIVLFLGVIYHLRNPLGALDRVRSVCREGGQMFLETQLATSPELRHKKVAAWQFFERATLGGDATSKWAPNPPGLVAAVVESQFEVGETLFDPDRGYLRAVAVRDEPLEHARLLDASVGEFGKPPAAPAGSEPVSTDRFDFDPETLPWVDRADFPAEAARRVEAGSLSTEELARLERWRREGYLHLPGLIEPERIDALLQEVEDAWRDRPANVQVLVEGKGSQPFPEVAPRSELTHHHFRLLDFQDVSEAARDLMLDEKLLRVLRTIFDDTPVAMQSLYFEYGSEQGIHQDFPYVQSGRLSHLVGCWIACEDVDDSNGPLFYNLGSHRLPKYDWGRDSLTYNGHDEEEIGRFEAFLKRQQEEHGLERQVFHAKKGDVLFWHAALAHGGSPATDRDRTRKSLVAHYSTVTAYRRDRRHPHADPERIERNGGLIYLPPKEPKKPSLLRRVVRKLAGR